MKWHRADNGYYFARPNRKTFYQIEVVVRPAGHKKDYSAKLWIEDKEEFTYLHGIPSTTLKYAKHIAQKHYDESVKNKKI